MRVLVVGAGGVGRFFGARLARAGVPVTFLARGPHWDAIRRDGLRVRSAADGEWTVKVDATDDPRELTPVDVVLFCVKSFDTPAAAEAIRPAIGPETAVVSLQNGVDNEDALARSLGAGHAVGGVAWVFAAIEAPGVIVHRLGGRHSASSTGARARAWSACGRRSPPPAWPRRWRPTSLASSGRSTS
jgi:2-dehydropantoate 2-reductase